jgi:16S rRNA (guanine527-N7)-methyltransferase
VSEKDAAVRANPRHDGAAPALSPLMSGLAELAERWHLDSTQVGALARSLELLTTDPLAPSTVDTAAALDVHIADSLSALALAAVRRARTVADLGSGSGFPGIALAIALPQATVALVESSGRRCAFLERLRAHAGVANAHVVHARAEAWPQGLAAHDLITARALAPLPVLCEYAAPLLRIGGALVAWKGAVSGAEAGAGEAAAQQLGLSGAEVIRSEPYAGSVAHHLHVYRKLAQTPPQYPRRPGIARRRPIGGGS